jgi:hypothetical protein
LTTFDHFEVRNVFFSVTVSLPKCDLCPKPKENNKLVRIYDDDDILGNTRQKKWQAIEEQISRSSVTKNGVVDNIASNKNKQLRFGLAAGEKKKFKKTKKCVFLRKKLISNIFKTNFFL